MRAVLRQAARQWALACCLACAVAVAPSRAPAGDPAAGGAEAPPLELLGFIADFSDEEEGWVDPREIESIFALDGDAEHPGGARPGMAEEYDAGSE